MSRTVDQTPLHRRLSRRARGLPAEIASHLINVPALARRLSLSYERQLAQHKAKLPALSDMEAQIVAGLRQDGVFITSLETLALAGTDGMLSSAGELMASYAVRAARGEFRRHYTILARGDELMLRPSILRWGLDRRLLRIVETYLGLPVAYDGLHFFYTVADGRQVATRLWHRDFEDRRMVKVTVYLHDVDADGGPYEILHRDFPGSESLSGFNYPILTQQELETRLGRAFTEADVTSCTGPAGTVIFSDPATRYHRGKPAVARDRAAIFYNYFARPPLRPFLCERSGLSRAQLRALATGLAPEQRACLLWREELPWFARMIPPAPL
ncbi:hypothetical protein IC762_04150 [Bradyrhizobium genosp. L]|uniref:hypothetical protein n=1 Tax=Bradyrhizobium genosp. L TaxID=83637 RepID=UPI0018A322CA|nr:hypothetical protein [Bradyrhizobium genosp. L]QPF85529.1 hypothetical protein IC762_04150 [Bradyrhizobium genosp. L]